MAGYAHDAGYNQRRMVAFVAIIVLHALIAWAFISGFGQAVVAKIAKDVQVSLIKPEETKETPPPPPKVDFKPPPQVSVPPPIVNIAIPIETPPVITTKEPPPPPPPRVVATVPSTPIKIVQTPDCKEDYYPAQALRENQAGTVVVKFCIGVNNKIDRPVEVVNTSGFPLLDEAAGKCLSAGRYKAGTIEGKPVASCQSIKVTFKPTER